MTQGSVGQYGSSRRSTTYSVNSDIGSFSGPNRYSEGLSVCNVQLTNHLLEVLKFGRHDNQGSDSLETPGDGDLSPFHALLLG